MKKILITILAFLYLGMSSGMAMTIHYCMGELSSVELFHTGKDKCPKCGMKNGHGCCKDEVKIYKVSDSHNMVTNDIQFVSLAGLLPVYQHSLTVNTYPVVIAEGPNNHSPPGSAGNFLRSMICVFRI